MSGVPRVGTPTMDLTPREREVVALVGTDKKNGQIANALGISECSVAMHVMHAREKVFATSRKELAEYARANGITP